MNIYRFKAGKFTVSFHYSPKGTVYAVKSYETAIHVHLGKIGFWYRYQ